MAKTHIMVKFVQQRKDMRAVMKNMTLPNSGLILASAAIYQPRIDITSPVSYQTLPEGHNTPFNV